jgi:predicted esterase
LLIGLVTPQLGWAANLADFIDYSLPVSRGHFALPGRLFVPPEAVSDPTRQRPLIVFLHGGGAIGSNNVTQVEHMPDFLLEEAKRRAAYLYAPQAPGGWASPPAIDSVMTMIERAVAERNVNANRLYATGYSNGGGGTWNLLSRNSGQFAAAMPLAGVAPVTGFNAANLIGTAILTAHSRDDPTVSVARSRDVVNGILSAAGQPLPIYPAAGSTMYYLVSNPHFEFHRELAATAPPLSTTHYSITDDSLDLIYFELPDGGHTGVLGAYYSPWVYDWMFSHSLVVPEPAALYLAAAGVWLLASTRPRRTA